jgi:hypothetical protein
MFKNCQKLATDASKELVECRRVQRETAKFVTIKQQLAESLNTLEQYVVFATLLG